MRRQRPCHCSKSSTSKRQSGAPCFQPEPRLAASVRQGVTDLDGGSESTVRAVRIDVRASGFALSPLAALSDLRPAHPELKRAFRL